MVKRILLLTLLSLFLILIIGCSGTVEEIDTNESIEEEPVVEEIIEEVSKEDLLCGNDVCDEGEIESCEKDCIVLCSENTDCLDDEVCGIGRYCETAETITTELASTMSNWTYSFEEKLSSIEFKEGKIQDILDSYVEIIDASEIEDLNNEISEFFSTVENEVDVLQFGIEDLNDEIPTYTTRSSDEFFEEYSELEDDYLSLLNRIEKEFYDYYTQMYELADEDDTDLFIKGISITEKTESKIVFAITVENIGTPVAQDPFDVNVEIDIENEDSQSCSEEFDSLDSGDEVVITCSINLPSLSENSGISLVINADVDYDSEVDEISETNNNFDFEMIVSSVDLQ